MLTILYEWISPTGVLTVLMILNTVQVWQTKRQTVALTERTKQVHVDMKQLEINTNDKMDKLLAAKDEVAVALEAKAAAEGREAGRIEAAARAAKEAGE